MFMMIDLEAFNRIQVHVFITRSSYTYYETLHYIITVCCLFDVFDFVLLLLLVNNKKWRVSQQFTTLFTSQFIKQEVESK